MRVYLNTNVFDESLSRIRRLFDEFDNIVVGFSGGKDSTICLQLALIVAEERNRLPLKVMWLDQEAEWEHVVKYVTSVMEDERIEPMWFQIDFKETSGTSANGYFHCWKPKAKWMRDKHPLSRKVNSYGTKSFSRLFTRIPEEEFGDENFCYISGVRAEESPARGMAVTQVATYKDITWGKVLNKKKHHYTFYPIYDWSYRDVWKAINENNWDYCKIYDFMYQKGVGINMMRISSVQHETAVHALFIMKEFEPKTWDKLVERTNGVNKFGKMKKASFGIPKQLPSMFDSWKEYRDYLMENLIQEEEQKIKYRKSFKRIDELYYGQLINLAITKACVSSILLNDYEMTKISNFKKIADVGYWLQWSRGKKQKASHIGKNKYINDSVARGEKQLENA